jgi:hypothetical protein
MNIEIIETPICFRLHGVSGVVEGERYAEVGLRLMNEYQALPQKWADLKAELAARGEVIASPSLEVYGHHCDDPAKLETTILIALRAKPA